MLHKSDTFHLFFEALPARAGARGRRHQATPLLSSLHDGLWARELDARMRRLATLLPRAHVLLFLFLYRRCSEAERNAASAMAVAAATDRKALSGGSVDRAAAADSKDPKVQNVYGALSDTQLEAFKHAFPLCTVYRKLVYCEESPLVHLSLEIGTRTVHQYACAHCPAGALKVRPNVVRQWMCERTAECYFSRCDLTMLRMHGRITFGRNIRSIRSCVAVVLQHSRTAWSSHATCELLCAVSP